MEKKPYHPSYGFETGFPLSNLLLYYLNWYHRSDDMWADVRKCVEADGFFAFSNYEITGLVLAVATEWNMYAANNGYHLIPVSACLLQDYQIAGWENLVKEDTKLFAMIWRLLGIFAFDYDRTQLKIKKPHFCKKSTLKPNGYLNGRSYTEANRNVEKYPNWA